MTSPGWPDIVARLHHTLAGCDRDTDLELAAGGRRLHLAVRRDTVRGHCPGYDERRLTDLGWQPPRDGGGWWYETPRTAELLHWWSGFVSRTAAAVLTAEPRALSCRVLAPAEAPAHRDRPEAGPTRSSLVDRAGAGDRSDPRRAEAGGQSGPGHRGEPGDHAGRGRRGEEDRNGADRPVEERLADAVERRDLPAYLGLLAAAAVCVPLSAEPDPEADFPWAVVADAAGAPLLPVFTSPDALTAFAGAGVPFVAVSFAELLADWPDRTWGLAVDAGTGWALTVAAPALTALLAANPVAG